MILKEKVIICLFLLVSLPIVSSFNFEGPNVVGAKIVEPIDEYGLEVSIQDYTGKAFSLFVTRELQTTNLSENYSVGTDTVTVTNSTNCLVGDAIDIYDNESYFQGIINEVNGDNITFTPELDVDYSQLDSFVRCGEWNLNLDGSSEIKEHSIGPPANKAWDIESIGMQFIDNEDWDISTFGSRTRLDNGFSVSVGDGSPQELFLIYNNGGFTLRGGVVQDFEKAPSGKYGFSVDMNFEEKYGAVLELEGEDSERIFINNRDDLTSIEEIAFVIRGHYKT